MRRAPFQWTGPIIAPCRVPSLGSPPQHRRCLTRASTIPSMRQGLQATRQLFVILRHILLFNVLLTLTSFHHVAGGFYSAGTEHPLNRTKYEVLMLFNGSIGFRSARAGLAAPGPCRGIVPRTCACTSPQLLFRSRWPPQLLLREKCQDNPPTA